VLGSYLKIWLLFGFMCGELAMNKRLRDYIIGWLQNKKQAATYTALAGCCGGSPRTVLTGAPKNAKYSWIVAKKTKSPSGYSLSEIDSHLMESIAQKGVITDPAVLERLLRGG
jgi:hypothetical protein